MTSAGVPGGCPRGGAQKGVCTRGAPGARKVKQSTIKPPPERKGVEAAKPHARSTSMQTQVRFKSRLTHMCAQQALRAVMISPLPRPELCNNKQKYGKIYGKWP